jgi:uroporphyrin-III C-methyltransferase/precorrin-2 dehydrogenase/sirohydrochlorin ferrochelatase
LVEHGTTPEQRVITATLADLPQLVAREAVSPPTLVIIGEIVRLHDRWASRTPGPQPTTLRATA